MSGKPLGIFEPVADQGDLPFFVYTTARTSPGMLWRGRAFGLSILAHIALLSLLLSVETAFEHLGNADPHYEVLVVPKKAKDRARRIIWFPSRQPLPEVTSQQRFGDSPVSRGNRDPARVLINRSLKAVSATQHIQQPNHPEPLPVDIPAPNLVALSTPAAPLAPKLPPKAFTPPPPRARPADVPGQNALPAASPTLDSASLQVRTETGAISLAPKLPPKLFVPPAAHAGGSVPRSIQEVSPGAPSSAAPTAAAGSGLDAVMVGLNPSAVPPPPGSREGQFARAPMTGLPASGLAVPGAISVPGLVAHSESGKSTESPVMAKLPASTRLPTKEVTLPGVNRTMSAPLRPSSRIIPASVEAQFTNREVYALVLPGPDFPDYAGDWVLWFSDRAEHTAVRALVLAPIPARKYIPSDPPPPAPTAPISATVQFAAVIDRTGHLSNPRVVRATVAEPLQRKAITDKALLELETWIFQPALWNGEPVDVDVVMEIPFHLRLTAQELARQ